MADKRYRGPVALPPPPKPDRRGPHTLTQGLITEICATVARGNYLDTAARYHGVPASTWSRWLKQGHEHPETIYGELLDRLGVAQAQADVRDHQHLANASEKDWRAAAKHLEIRNRNRYGQRLEVTGADGNQIEFAEGVSAGLVELFKRLAGPIEDEKTPTPVEQGPAQSKPTED